MKDSRIYRNMKIARAGSTVKLGCSDRCGLPLNASERISEQALSFSQEAADVISEAYLTSMTGDRLDKLAALYVSMIIEVSLTPS